MFDERRRVDPIVCAEADLAVRVDVLGEWGETASWVEFLRLVDDKTDDTDGCFGQGLETRFGQLRFENWVE